MPYLPLPNFNHDSGPRRIQSGPDHEGYVVLYSGVESTGADDGFAVLGAPLSGTAALGAWDYDSNWRYVPSTLPSQSGSLDPTPYNVSGALDTYDATRIYTRDNVGGAQAASAIGPETGKINPRGGALQARSDVTRPETYMYFGGAAPDNQDYSPYNTPDANSAAEGKTGGGVTHRSFESSLLTNVLGSQGTSDRSQWRYHQPVYCKTYTETRRSDTPGLMSTPLRYVYRGSASSYNYNYGGELLANKGGFELLPYDDEKLGCPFSVGCPTKTGSPSLMYTEDVLTAVIPCNYISVEWYNTFSTQSIGSGLTYTVSVSDVGSQIYFVVTYPDGSTDSSSVDCYGIVEFRPVSLDGDYFAQYITGTSLNQVFQPYPTYFENDGTVYCLHQSSVGFKFPVITKISADRQSILWSTTYRINDGFLETDNDASASFCICGDNDYIYLFMSRLNTVDYRKTNLHLLALSKTNGQVISNDISTFTNTTISPIAAIRNNSNTVSVLTDGLKNFWLLFEVPVDVNQGRSILSATKTDTGLVINWCYLLPVTDRRGPTILLRTSALTLSLEFKYGKIKISPYKGGGSTTVNDGVDLTLIDPYTGVFELRKQPLIIDNALTRSSLDSTIDEEGNIYHVYVDSVSYTVQTKFYIIKRSATDTTIWAKDYHSVIIGGFANPPSLQFDGSDLLVCVEKLAGGVTPDHFIHLLRIDKNTGDLKRVTRIEPPRAANSGWNALFIDPKMIPWKNDGEYIIQDGIGYRLGVNPSQIPVPFFSGVSVNSLSSNTPSGYWRFTERSTAGVVDASVVSGAGAIPPIYSYSAYGTIESFKSDPVYVVTSGALSSVQYRYISKLA